MPASVMVLRAAVAGEAATVNAFLGGVKGRTCVYAVCVARQGSMGDTVIATGVAVVVDTWPGVWL